MDRNRKPPPGPEYDAERDLPEQAEIERERAEHLRRAEKMEAVGLLAGGVAHDLNNILSGILGFTSYLLSKTPEGTDLHRDLGLIEQSGVRAADLTRQLLALAHRRHFPRETVPLNQVIDELLAELKTSLPKGVVVEKKLAQDLPAVYGDRSQLKQAVGNLCQNAVEAMAEGGGTLMIVTERRALTEREQAVLAREGHVEYVCVSVRDTGKGISPKVQARLFDPFFTTKPKRAGAGMGLAIVYGIVANHHGEITFESAEDWGTTFEVFFPVYEAGQQEREHAHERKLEGTETVMIVDDEPIVRQMVVEVLRAHGYTPLAAASGEDALKMFESVGERVRLILLDLIMPGIGSEAAFRAIREKSPHMPILLISGFAQDELSERLIRQGALGIIYKPCRSDALLVALRDALDKKPA